MKVDNCDMIDIEAYHLSSEDSKKEREKQLKSPLQRLCPILLTFETDVARSRLYRSQSLQVNTHFAAFFKIYKITGIPFLIFGFFKSFAPFSQFLLQFCKSASGWLPRWAFRVEFFARLLAAKLGWSGVRSAFRCRHTFLLSES